VKKTKKYLGTSFLKVLTTKSSKQLTCNEIYLVILICTNYPVAVSYIGLQTQICKHQLT
jgi:hypothetical protein